MRVCLVSMITDHIGLGTVNSSCLGAHESAMTSRRTKFGTCTGTVKRRRGEPGLHTTHRGEPGHTR